MGLFKYLLPGWKGRGPGFKLVLFFICLWLHSGLGPAEAGPAEKPYFTDVGQFNYARFLMNEHEYRVAAREFGRLIENFPSSPLIPESQFRLAEAYFLCGSYREAKVELEMFLSNFKESPFATQAATLIASAEERLKGPLLPPSRMPEIYPEMRPGLRAVQVMFFEGKSYPEIDREIKRLRSEGVDTVIARVFHNPGDRFYPSTRPNGKSGVYFKTSKSPVVDDMLGELAGIAHKNGVKVFAWMTTRYADYGIEARRDLACTGYDLASRRYARCKGLDLFNEEAVGRLESIYRDLAAYEIDGILFQDDLVLRHNEGFGPAARALFKTQTGFEADPALLYQKTGDEVHYTELFWKWAQWKNTRLLEVAKRLRKAVQERRPGVKFAINLMYENLTNPPFALAWLSQSLPASMQAGFDYYSIMAYHRQMQEELRKDPEAIRDIIEDMVRQAADTVKERHKVLIKIQTVDWHTGEPLSNAELVSLIRSIKGLDGVSLAVVPYRSDFPFHEMMPGAAVALAGAARGQAGLEGF